MPGGRFPDTIILMGAILAIPSRCNSRNFSGPRAIPAVCVFSLGLLLFLAGGCKKIRPIDTTPLDNVGMAYSSIQDIKALDVTDTEVAELAKAKQAGITDPTCVELFRISRSRNQPFKSGDAVAGLFQVGMSEESILELARLNQLGLGVGELQAIRLAGLPDSIVLDVARRHANAQPVLSGPSIAQLMNTGMSRETIHELIRRGVSDDQARTIIALKRHRAGDAEILRRYPAASSR